MHSCDVLNKRGFARPYVLLEHTLVLSLSLPPPIHPKVLSKLFWCTVGPTNREHLRPLDWFRGVRDWNTRERFPNYGGPDLGRFDVQHSMLHSVVHKLPAFLPQTTVALLLGVLARACSSINSKTNHLKGGFYGTERPRTRNGKSPSVSDQDTQRDSSKPANWIGYPISKGSLLCLKALRQYRPGQVGGRSQNHAENQKRELTLIWRETERSKECRRKKVPVNKHSSGAVLGQQSMPFHSP